MLMFDTKRNFQLLYYAGQNPTRLAAGQSPAFHTGYNQVNTIGGASGSTITWYANERQVGSLHDSNYNEDEIRLTPWVYCGHRGKSKTVFSDLRVRTF
jgi:hypothetical protein